MFYLPGIDGTGLAASRQFPLLRGAFDLRCLLIPASDRTPFEQLTELVEGLIRADVNANGGGRPVYLLGESFGAVLALALAEKLGGYVDRIVLVNPATSFDRSMWPAAGGLLTAVPAPAYRALPLLLSPLMTNPLAMAMSAVDPRAPLEVQASDTAYALLDLLPQLSAMRLVLPPATLAWRLELLRQGAAAVAGRLRSVAQRTLILAGGLDLMIPSAEEAERLAAELPRGRARVLPLRSHALLQEAGVDLVELVKEEGFYTPERVMSNGRPSTSAAGPSTSYGRPAPLALPTREEVKRDAGFVDTIRRLCSPVFFSTAADGAVLRGLGAIPSTRPLLFVGNHQFFAADMYPMIQEFLLERNMLLRGLAHPIVFADPGMLRRAATNVAGGDMTGGAAPASVASSIATFVRTLTSGGAGTPPTATAAPTARAAPGGGEGGRDGGAGAAGFQSLLSTYGAVPVSGRNMHALLAAGEAVLLFPGGAREAFKRKGENYQLIWPERSEFVRMAAKFGATIIPFAAIGADEGVTQVLDANDLQALGRQLPPLGRLLEERRVDIPAARVGVNATMDDVDAFVQPIIAPNVPSRFYYVFRQPIPTSPELASDRAGCDALYTHVKSEVEDGLGYLLRKREADPYKDLLPRLVYELSHDGRQAPAFDP